MGVFGPFCYSGAVSVLFRRLQRPPSNDYSFVAIAKPGSVKYHRYYCNKYRIFFCNCLLDDDIVDTYHDIMIATTVYKVSPIV